MTTTITYAVRRSFAGLACALTLLALCLLSTPTARAAAPPGAPVVLVVELLEVDTEQRAQALTNSLRDAIFDATDFALNTDNPQLMPTILDAKCDASGFGPRLSDSSDRSVNKVCLARVAKRVGAKHGYFWGYLFVNDSGQRMVKLHLWQKGEDRSVVLPYDERDRKRTAERLYRHLVSAGKVGDARFVVEGRALKGELFVNSRPQGPFDGSAIELTLPLGEVAAEVKTGDKVLARGKGAVAASGLATVRLEPVVEPAPPPPVASAVPTEPVRQPPPPEPSGSWQRPVGWVALGVGVVGIGFGIFANSRVSSLNKDFGSDPKLVAYRQGVPSGATACDRADEGAASGLPDAASPGAVSDHCASQRTWRGVRAASYIGGGLLAAGGAALLLFAPSGKAPGEAQAHSPRWTAAPSLGPSFAGASFATTW